MQNIIRILGILALLILGASNPTSTKKYKIRKVIIDAGHGGYDAGAVGKFSKEKDIALQIALGLGGLLKKYMRDVEVIYTRDTDKFVTLHNRAKIANTNNFLDAAGSHPCNFVIIIIITILSSSKQEGRIQERIIQTSCQHK